MLGDIEVSDLVREVRTLVFDFDGTLVHSNPIKWKAIEVCFSEFRQKKAEIAAYCRGSNHTPRGDKFRHVYEQILGFTCTDEIAIRLHEQFARATTHGIIAAPEVPGATRLLFGVMRSYMLALLSSTPEEILLDILKERGWKGYFKFLKGAPVEKTSWQREFRNAHKLKGNEVVFFGDTKEDADSAQKSGYSFVSVGRQKLRAGYFIADFTQLPLFVRGSLNG